MSNGVDAHSEYENPTRTTSLRDHKTQTAHIRRPISMRQCGSKTLLRTSLIESIDLTLISVHSETLWITVFKHGVDALSSLYSVRIYYRRSHVLITAFDPLICDAAVAARHTTHTQDMPGHQLLYNGA